MIYRIDGDFSDTNLVSLEKELLMTLYWWLLWCLNFILYKKPINLGFPVICRLLFCNSKSDLNYFLNKFSIFAKTVLRWMYINHELPAFTTNGCKWVQDQPEFYRYIPKVGGTGLDRAFYRSFSEKVLKKHCFAQVLHAICMCIDLQFFLRIHEHNWGRLDSKPSKSVTPRCNAKYKSYITLS